MKLFIIGLDGVVMDTKSHGDDRTTRSVVAGSLEAVARLNQAGYRIVLIADGRASASPARLDIEELAEQQAWLHRQLAKVGAHISALFMPQNDATDDAADNHALARLYEQIGQRFGTDLLDVPLVSSRLEHLLPGMAKGARAMLTGSPGSDNEHPGMLAALPGCHVYADLAQAVDAVLAEEQQ